MSRVEFSSHQAHQSHGAYGQDHDSRGSEMIRVELPYHLRNLAGTGKEISLALEEPGTFSALLDAIEARYPTLRGTIRDQATGERRPFIRFFACGEDWSHHPPETPLPDCVLRGEAVLRIVGAMAGG
jgi:molybdopterin synthase sulfur carrier subunit